MRNRSIRQWITQQVIPRLRQEERFDGTGPYRKVIHWQDRDIEVQHSQGNRWLH